MSWLGNNGFSRESMKALGEAYSQIYENRFAAHAGKDTDAGAAYAKPTKGGNKKGVYTMKGKDGKPLFNKEDVELDEVYKGKHGQSDKEYADSRSQGGKMVSGDSKMSGAEYTHGRRVKAENPGMQPDVGGKTKPKSQGKMDRGTRADIEYRKANLKKEDAELDELIEDEYEVSFEDGCQLDEGKKKCKEGYKWDSDKGKCVKKKKSSSKSSKTTIIVKGRGGGMYGPGYIGGHGGSNGGGDNGGEGETESGGGDGGGDGGGGE